MALPFLQKRNIASIIMAKQTPTGSIEETKDTPKEDEGLIQASEDLLKAVAAKDAEAVAKALRAAFEMCDSYKDAEEGESDEA